MHKQLQISIDFKGAQLRGSHFYQDNSGKVAVLLVHGFGETRTGHGRAFVDLSDLLVAQGFQVYSFDRLGHGVSDGLFEDSLVSNEIEQIGQMLDYIKDNGCTSIHILGHSLGGMEAAQFVARFPEVVESLTLWAAAAVFAYEIGEEGVLQGKSIAKAEKTGVFDFKGQSLGLNFIEEAKNFKPYQGLEQFRKKVFIHQGKEDQVVPFKYAERYSRIWKDNSTLYAYEKADHGWNNVTDRKLLLERTMNDLVHL